MKRKINPLLIFGGLAAAAAVFLAARNKARAAQNLRFEPVDIAIDSEKTKRALGLRLYYRVKIRLINDEPAAIQVNRVNLTAQTNGRALGNLVSAQGFTVPANGNQVVQLDTSIASFGLVSTILDFIRNRQPVPVNVAGFIDTDLGRVTVNYNTTLGGGIFGPRYTYKVTDCMDVNDCDYAIRETVEKLQGRSPNYHESIRLQALRKRRAKFAKREGKI